MSTLKKASFVTCLLASTASATKYKFGVFSDIHLQPNYMPDRPPSQYCEVASKGRFDEVLTENAYFGRIGCDVPY